MYFKEEERLRRRLYMKTRQKSKTRGYPYLLSFDQYKFLASLNCHYCNEPPYKRVISPLTRYPRPVYMNQVDRVDSALGYFMGNCVPCCPMCNSMKSNYDVNEFIDRVFLICANIVSVSEDHNASS